ncbi:MAG: hypothetical protein EP349_00075 [Alphaproteobacteria bacterium]|nr:MAG: hypothetical protein EP349_00075 [Alphaproteobacteria bacterium]
MSSVKEKAKKVAKYVLMAWFGLVLLGVSLNIIGGLVAGDDVTLKQAFSIEEGWYGFIITGPPDISEQLSGDMNVVLPPYTQFYGPLSSMEECQDTAISLMSSLNEPEASAYICGLNCKENGHQENQTCEVLETGRYTAVSE